MWGIADHLHHHGAELAFTYQSEALDGGYSLSPVRSARNCRACDVSEPAASKLLLIFLHWPRIDFVVHAIAYSDKEELSGKYIDTSRENFLQTLIYLFSFLESPNVPRVDA